MVRNNRRHQNPGGSWSASIIGFIPDKGRLAVDLHGFIGPLALKSCDLQRLDVHCGAGHRLDRAGKGECDRARRTLVGDADDACAQASIELRGTHGNEVAHLRMGVRVEIVDNEDIAARACELGDARQTEVDAVGQTAESAGFCGTFVHKIVGLEVIGQRHFPAEMIERESAGNGYLVERGDLFCSDVSTDEN